MLKKAMIMAAGVGSRLGALSEILPKPLAPLANEPAMDIILKHLKSYGIKDLIANTYYKSEIIQEHYKKDNLGVNIQFIKEVELSGTAGGMKKCQFFFDKDDDFIVMSGDGLSDINIEEAYKSHKKSNAIATLVLKNVEVSEVSMYGIVVPDKNGFVDSFQEKPKQEEAKSTLANTGIYIFNYRIFEFIPENTFYDFAKNVFPSLLSSGEKINTYTLNSYWSDIGSIHQYKLSNKDVLNHKIKTISPVIIHSQNGKYCVGENFKIDETSSIIGECIIGNNCTIGKNAKVINSILWNNIKIEDNTVIENCIILDDTKVKTSRKDEILTKEKEYTTV